MSILQKNIAILANRWHGCLRLVLLRIARLGANVARMFLLFFALLIFSHASLAASLLTWALDESAGSIAADSSGLGNTGSLTGSTSWVTGKVAGGLSFNGTSGALTRSAVQGLVTGNTPHTLAAWVKVNALPSNRAWIALLGQEGNGSHHWLITNTGTTQLGVWNGAQVYPTLPVGQWKHIAITFDGSQIQGYIDGTLIGTQAATFGFTTTGLTVAQSHNGEGYFNGVVDEVRIYDRALSATEVTSLVSTTAPPPTISTATLASGTVGITYSQTLTASGGSTPYTWSISSGNLPKGFSLNVGTGAISGAPTTSGTSSFTVRVQDNAGAMASKAFTLTIAAESSGGILAWALDESVGITAIDSSGLGNTGSLTGGTSWVTGKVAGGLSFNGTSGALTRSAVQGLATGNTPHTLAAWVKVNALPSNRAWIALLGQEGNGSHHWLINSAGLAQLGVWNGAQVYPTLPVGQWKHIAITFDGSQLKGYIDGTLIGTQAATFAFTSNALTFAQSHNGEGYFNGVVDEVRIYDRALSATEVTSLVGTTAPTVSLSSPSNGATFAAPATISLSANAIDSDGIAKVEYYVAGNSTPVASSTGPAPYSANWGSVAAGTYSLTAKAYDGLGATAVSAPISITVNAASGSNIYYIYTDHLNTPRVITNTSNTVVWRWDSDPFGTTMPNENPAGIGTFAYNLRFPGQYFDQETGLHYNYFRDCYDPSTGRYCEADPIGLLGGLNLYSYANQNPLTFTDPNGKAAAAAGLISGGILIGGVWVAVNSSRPTGLAGKLEGAWDKFCKGKDDPCKDLVAEIERTVNKLNLLYNAMLVDPYGLFSAAFDKPSPAVTGVNSTWKGHIADYEGNRAKLNDLIVLAKQIPCTYPASADLAASRPPPMSPNLRR